MGYALAEYPVGRLAVLQAALALNPGKVFAEPDGWVGNRPFFDAAKYPNGFLEKNGARNPDGSPVGVLLDGQGYFGLRADMPYVVTPQPSGPLDTRLIPDAWTLPPVAVVVDPHANVSALEYMEPITMIPRHYDVHRDGTITPSLVDSAVPDIPPEPFFSMFGYPRSAYRTRSYAVPYGGGASSGTSSGSTSSGGASSGGASSGATSAGTTTGTTTTTQRADGAVVVTAQATQGTASVWPWLLLLGGGWLLSRGVRT